MEYLGLKDSDKCISTPSDDFSDAQMRQIEQLGKLLSVRISSNHKTSPPLVSDDVYICSSSSVSSSSPIVLPTGCPIGKKIIIKSVGANGYVQSSEGIMSLSGTSKSTSAQSISKSVRSFLYTGTTYGWMMGY